MYNFNKQKKETVSNVKFEAYNSLYMKLGTKEGKGDLYKLTEVREKEN